MASPDPKITLSNPVNVDGKEVTEITLRRPKAGELRGLQIQSIAMGDVNAVIKLVPRISQPPLSETDMANMDVSDFGTIATVLTMMTSGKAGNAVASMT